MKQTYFLGKAHSRRKRQPIKEIELLLNDIPRKKNLLSQISSLVILLNIKMRNTTSYDKLFQKNK